MKIESAVYKPFGEQSEWLSGQPAPEDKGWIGERYDADAGLQYLNARYYDPVLGMFLQPDWFEVTMPGVGTNRYAYSFNDPVNRMDPGGNNADWFMSQDECDKFNGELAEANREAAQDMREGFYKDRFPEDQWEARAEDLDAQAGWFESRIGISRGARISLDLLGAAELVPAGGVAVRSGKNALNASTAAAKELGIVPKSTRALGLWGEARLAAMLGNAGVKPNKAVRTAMGLRYHDRIIGNVAYEAKAGLNVKLTAKIRAQIDKDAFLINSKEFSRIEWHFFQGASPEVLDYLTRSGLPFVLH